MTILPGQTPCLRCVFEAAPAPGETGTCETAGVLGPIVNIIASYQATEAFKILTGQIDQINRDLLYIDIWENVFRPIKVAPLLGKVDCPCCQRRRFEWLDGAFGSQTTSLCGRNAVQVSHRSAAKLNFEDMARAAATTRRRQLQPLPAEVQRRGATSSRYSPTAGPSSRAPATSIEPAPCTLGTSDTENLAFSPPPRLRVGLTLARRASEGGTGHNTSGDRRAAHVTVIHRPLFVRASGAAHCSRASGPVPWRGRQVRGMKTSLRTERCAVTS